MTGWPHETRPGVPLNPKRDGWHWLTHAEDGLTIPKRWNAECGAWEDGIMVSPATAVEWGVCYAAPCLTPAEVAAREAAAAEAMREAAAAEIADIFKDQYAADCILVLPTPHADALAAAGRETALTREEQQAFAQALRRSVTFLDDAVSAAALAKAEKRGMERAAEIARRVGKDLYGNRSVTGQEAADCVATAIRAAAREGGA